MSSSISVFPRRLMIPLWCALLLGSLSARVGWAQAKESAEGPGHSLWVGGAFSDSVAHFPYQSNQRILGVAAFGDYHLAGNIGLETEARFLRFNGFENETEESYLAGPRYFSSRFGKIQPYGQFLIGLGRIQFPFKIGTGQYFALAPGGGANFRVGRRWSLCADYEFQIWTGSPNFSNEPAHKLTPNGFNIGVLYRLFR